MNSVLEFFEDKTLILSPRGKPRVPWKASQPNDDAFITLPVFLGFCGIASALRSSNRRNARFKAVLCLSEVASMSVYTAAARVFLNRIADYEVETRPSCPTGVDAIQTVTNSKSKEWAGAIVVKGSDKAMDDGARLFAYTVLDVPMLTRRHVEVALMGAQSYPNRNDYMVGDTRVVSNGRGYPKERSGFNPTYAVELSANPRPKVDIVDTALAILDSAPETNPHPSNDIPD